MGLALFFYLSAVVVCTILTVVDYAVEGVAGMPKRRPPPSLLLTVNLVVDDFFSVLPGCYADGVPAMIAGY